MTEIAEAVKRGVLMLRNGVFNYSSASTFLLKENPDLGLTHNALRQRIMSASGEAPPNTMDKLSEYCTNDGTPINSIPYYWDKSDGLSLLVKNPHYVAPLVSDKPTYNDLRDGIIADMNNAAPKYPKLTRQVYNDPHLLVVDPADAHFGKYATKSETGQDSNLSLTEQKFAAGIEGLLQKVSGYKFEKIIYVGGNDVLHTDNAINTTTSGTKQDTGALWHEHYRSAKKATIAAIDRLLLIADVHFVFCPSNHDFTNGFFLCDAIMSHYHNNKNITFDVDPIHRKYIQYGTSLIGLTHGDGAKESDLSDLLKTEAKAAWSVSEYCYWYVHHIHHKVKSAKKGSLSIKLEKDYRGVTVMNTGKALAAKDYCFVEYVRSISGPDRWHLTNGYSHSFQAMEAFIHHPEHGQVNRITHLF
jgi:hypothetical protein